MNYIDALSKKDALFMDVMRRVKGLEEIRDVIRNILLDKGAIKQVQVDIGYISPYNCVGIDSAFGVQRNIVVNFYAASCIAIEDINGVSLVNDDANEIDIISFAEDDTYYTEKILSGISLGTELILAARKTENFDYIFMDGSTSTFNVRLNSSLMAAESIGMAKLSKQMREIYPEAVYAFRELLSSNRVCFIPKSSQKTQLKELIERVVNANKININLDGMAHISDQEVANIILEPLEYIEVISDDASSYHFQNPAKDVELQKDINETLNNMENMRVFYFKGISGYAIKTECFTNGFPAETISQYVIDKTFYLTNEADRLAKEYVKGLLDRVFPVEESIRTEN